MWEPFPELLDGVEGFRGTVVGLKYEEPDRVVPTRCVCIKECAACVTRKSASTHHRARHHK